MRTPAYRHTQKAPLCWILYGMAIYSLVVAGIIGEMQGIYITLVVSLILFSLAPCFHHLTVLDRGDVLGIRFGPVPLFRTSVRYDEIAAVDTGRTLLLDGWGIHWSRRGGWVWNLWGRDCVIVQFKNGNRLQIGTDDAENLAEFLQCRVSEV